MAHHGVPLKNVAFVPPPPEPKPRPRTVNTNRRHVERLQELTGSGRVLRQRVVLFGDSWFERFTYEGRNNGVEPFTEHVQSCADQGADSVENAKNNLLILGTVLRMWHRITMTPTASQESS